MAIYDQLAHVFPRAYIMPEADAAEVAAFLVSTAGMDRRQGEFIANGTSFAVTARQGAGMRCVWLSATSYDRMEFEPGFARKLYEADVVHMNVPLMDRPKPSWERVT
jgi:hypothetical protein